MSVIWKGSTAIQLQRVESRWTAQRGWEATYIYLGEKSLIAAAATNSAYVQYATDVQVVPDRNLSELRVTFASTDNAQPDQYTELSNIWTLTPYELQRNTQEHPRYADLATITNEEGFLQRVVLAVDEYKKKVSTGISAGNSDKDLVFSLGDYITYDNATNSNISTANEALAAELASLLVREKTTDDYDKYVLRNVKIVPPNTSLAANHFKKRHQWSTPRVIDLMTSGPPSVTSYSIVGDLIDTFPTTRWLKKPPIISQLSDGKYEIVTEFVELEPGEKPTELNPLYL